MATVYWFSATGNSLYVAQQISDSINASLHPMTVPITTCDDDVVGFIFPTYFMDLPIIVSKFIKKMTFTAKNPYIFAVTTYGGFSFGVPHYLNQLFNEKGLYISYFEKIRSVENYIPSLILFVDDIPQVHSSMEKRIMKISNDLQSFTRNKKNGYSIVNIVMRKANPLHSGKPFDCNFKTDGCIGCGICTQICPNRNITLENSKPIFHGNCELCTACFHSCPQQAIYWKHSKNKKHYRHPAYTLHELIKFLHPEK